MMRITLIDLVDSMDELSKKSMNEKSQFFEYMKIYLKNHFYLSRKSICVIRIISVIQVQAAKNFLILSIAFSMFGIELA